MRILFKNLNTRFIKYGLSLSLLLPWAISSFGQHATYAPNSIHFCQLQKKYAATLSGGIGRGNSFSSMEWQAAFSPIRHGAIMINYFDAHRKAVLRQEEEGSSSGFGEIGVGAYETTALGTASLFVGFGLGSVFNNYTFDRAASFDLQRWFIQPSIVRHSKNFEWGVALRFTRLVYSHGIVDYSIAETDLRAVRAIEAKSPFFIPELGLHAGMTFSPFTLSLNLTNVFYAASTYNFERVNSSFLLSLDLGSLYKRKQPK